MQYTVYQDLLEPEAMGSREEDHRGPGQLVQMVQGVPASREGERLDLCISGGAVNWVQGLSVATRSILTQSEEGQSATVRQLWQA